MVLLTASTLGATSSLPEQLVLDADVADLDVHARDLLVALVGFTAADTQLTIGTRSTSTVARGRLRGASSAGDGERHSAR